MFLACRLYFCHSSYQEIFNIHIFQKASLANLKSRREYQVPRPQFAHLACIPVPVLNLTEVLRLGSWCFRFIYFSSLRTPCSNILLALNFAVNTLILKHITNQMDDSERALVGQSLLQSTAETQHLERTVTPPGSLLSTLTDHLSCRHLIIQGPSKSGRSSLLMDLACDLAARAPCRCVGDRPCSCLAVVLFLPLTQEEFPLHCQQQPGDKTRSFHKQTLKRIQIRRIANPRDLQQQLWKIQGAGWHEQPCALLLDGLECITSFTQEESLPASQSPTPIQTRALQSLMSKFSIV